MLAYYADHQAALGAEARATMRCHGALHSLRGVLRDGTCHPAVAAECRAELAARWRERRMARRRLARAYLPLCTARESRVTPGHPPRRE